MKKALTYFLIPVIGIVLMGLVIPVQAKEQTVSMMAPWDGKGRIFKVGPDKLKFLGAFEGIIYFQNAEGALDAAVFICPAVQEIDLKTGKVKVHGNFIITGKNGDQVFADYSGAGVMGATQGKFTITGGTGEFEGIKGSGDMVARTVLGAMAVSLESGATISAAKGLAVWPELKLTTPK